MCNPRSPLQIFYLKCKMPCFINTDISIIPIFSGTNVSGLTKFKGRKWDHVFERYTPKRRAGTVWKKHTTCSRKLRTVPFVGKLLLVFLLACRSRQASIVLERYFRFEISLLSILCMLIARMEMGTSRVSGDSDIIT